MAVHKKEQKGSSFNVYLYLVIILLVVTLGGGLWLVGKSNDVRLDELTIRLTSQTGQIRSELFGLRKELDSLRKENARLLEACTAAQPAPAPTGKK